MRYCLGAYRERRNPICRFSHPNLPEDATVDGLVQFDEKRLISKVAGSGVMFIWNFEDALAQTGNFRLIMPEKILSWSETDEMYLNIYCDMNNKILVAGDANGRTWLYKVRNLDRYTFTAIFRFLQHIPLLQQICCKKLQ